MHHAALAGTESVQKSSRLLVQSGCSNIRDFRVKQLILCTIQVDSASWISYYNGCKPKVCSAVIWRLLSVLEVSARFTGSLYFSECLVLPPVRVSSPLCVLQILYKEAVKKELPCPVYHQLPDTLETQFARELTDMQSHVRAGTLHSEELSPT